MSIKESILMLVNALIRHGLKDQIKVLVSGKRVNPADVAWVFCVGADFVLISVYNVRLTKTIV